MNASIARNVRTKAITKNESLFLCPGVLVFFQCSKRYCHHLSLIQLCGQWYILADFHGFGPTSAMMHFKWDRRHVSELSVTYRDHLCQLFPMCCRSEWAWLSNMPHAPLKEKACCVPSSLTWYSPQYSSKAVTEKQLLSNSERRKITGLDPKTDLVNTQHNNSKDL